MGRRVTLQDIADALGVSRNTVSKAINNTGILADDTKEKVLRKAVEMGYKQFSYMNAAAIALEEQKPQAGAAGEIALLTRGFATSTSYLSVMLDRFQSGLCQMGFGFTMHRVREEEEDRLQLPASFVREKVSGIICIEMLDSRYCSMLCGLNLPVLFMDSPAAGLDRSLRADFVYADNQWSYYGLVKEMARRGKTRIGFIGESMHCQSFFERYMGYRNAMYLMGLPCREDYCIIENKEGARRPSSDEYREYLAERLSKLDALPEVFLCANDYVAFDAMKVLKQMGILVPRDIWLCGFDDIKEAQIITPSLTTVHVHGHAMGDSAVYLLASRIKEPSLECRSMYVRTSLIYRESTGD